MLPNSTLSLVLQPSVATCVHAAHLLAPLTSLTGKSKWTWGEDQQKAFSTMKAMVAVEMLMACPDHNVPFNICTDASDCQMGANIMQHGKIVACWSQKFNAAQCNYTAMEKELLSVICCLKELCSMLLGTRLTVHADHKNLTFHKLNSRQVLCWRLLLEDFAP